ISCRDRVAAYRRRFFSWLLRSRAWRRGSMRAQTAAQGALLVLVLRSEESPARKREQRAGGIFSSVSSCDGKFGMTAVMVGVLLVGAGGEDGGEVVAGFGDEDDADG